MLDPIKRGLLYERCPKLTLRILLVDDHEIVRRGIASFLATRWEVCGEARDGLEAVAKVSELKPDVAILDLSMPVMGGTAAARQIRSLVDCNNHL